jgi:hypothetical protein
LAQEQHKKLNIFKAAFVRLFVEKGAMKTHTRFSGALDFFKGI